MTDAAMLERRYCRLLRWYPRWFRDDIEDEALGVLMAGARDGQRWPSVAEAADVLGSALRMRFRLPPSGTESRTWSDAWAVFSVLGPVFLLLTNIVVVLVPPSFLRVHEPGPFGGVPYQASWLAPPSGVDQFYPGLISKAIVVVLVLAGWRWLSLVVLVASVAPWMDGQFHGLPLPFFLLNLGVWILELGALAGSPGPRRGRALLNWGHGVVVVLVVAAVKLSSMAYPVLTQPYITPPLLAWVLLLGAAALIVTAAAAARRLRLGPLALWIGAALLYPYLLQYAPILLGRGHSGLLRFVYVNAPVSLAITFLMPVVMAVLTVLIAARARLASFNARRLTPGS